MRRQLAAGLRVLIEVEVTDRMMYGSGLVFRFTRDFPVGVSHTFAFWFQH